MATFDFLCPACQNVQEEWVSRPSLADGIHPPCGKCGVPTSKTFIASNFKGQLVLAGNWDSKLAKESKYRAKRSQEMAVRQRDNNHSPKLIPNVNGEQVDSWRDAKKLASEKGLNTTHYDAKVDNLAKGNA